MSEETIGRVLFWAPRLLGIAFAAFLTVFALDVFEEGLGAREMTAALGAHLIPTVLILAMTALAWKWERMGALLFLGLGIAYLAAFPARLHWSAYLAISGPLFLTGALFLASWRHRAGRRQA
jgi:hypothetical protein